MPTQTKKELGYINLQGGWPSPSLHPVEAIKAATAALYSRSDINDQLMYGPEHGILDLRVNIGNWLTDFYKPTVGAVSAERLLISNGASNGLATVLQKFSDPSYTRAVWMVEPTYFLACPVVRDAGLADAIRGAPEGDDGVDLAFLSREMEKVDVAADRGNLAEKRPWKTPRNGYNKLYRHIVYMIPTFSNPSGKTMARKSREQLIHLARKHDALIVSDDVYDVLQWPLDESAPVESIGPCQPRLVDIDRELKGQLEFGNAVSNGSFSKIIAPGIRVGWLEGTPAFIEAMATVGATMSGGCQGHFASLIVNQMLESDALTKHIKEFLIPTYRARHGAMVLAIKEYLYPLGIVIIAQDNAMASTYAGGFFLYISFDRCPGVTADAVTKVALDIFNVRIAHGEMFAVPDDPASKDRGQASYFNGARLCWAWNEKKILTEGIQRLASAVKMVQEAKPNGKISL